MLSPKMQRSVRVNDAQLILLAERASGDNGTIRQRGYLQKRSTDSNRWQMRFFLLYQNLLFYYDHEHSARPTGVIFLEGCYVERIIAPSTTANSVVLSQTLAKNMKEDRMQHAFSITYRKENTRPYELKANTNHECEIWMNAICEASFNKLLLTKEELEHKHVHLLQVVESEKTAKWQYTRQCDELAVEIKKLRAEVATLRRECPMPRRHSIRSTAQMLRGSHGNLSFGSAGVVGASSGMGGASALGSIVDGIGGIGAVAGSLDESLDNTGQPKDTADLRKIKKVQSFFRGWLCRRRWKQIVEEYIKSPHAESMRRRNHLVFGMVEAEEEYTEQLETLVACFYRPFKMAASAKRPPCSHEELSSIFLNSETVLFLHQIFLKGLTSRLESWPTLVLGDLFDMLLPMLSIYQEFVRNHHFSLQMLAECKSNNSEFTLLLRRLEAKSQCQGRSIEQLLTAPMSQIPRYIVTLHELLAHTPHDHVERKSLLNARQKLEDLSRQMHDEVSETENLRKNLAVERMIVEGCDILLDVNQVFVRQGSLIQVPVETKGRFRSRLASFKGEKDAVRQCFLFSNNLIIATRTSSGRLHLLPDVGKIVLADATLIEDPSDSERDEEVEHEPQNVHHASERDTNYAQSAVNSPEINENLLPPLLPHTTTPMSNGSRDFKIIIDQKSGGRHSIHLMASTVQDKQAWISDIAQCMDNIHMHSMSGLVGPTGGSIAAHEALKTDPRLFKDDVDIRFSKTLNSCKLPQVRYATPERLLQRLIDLRFLSIDFLNTFLLTYRVFTDSETVLTALQNVFFNPPVDEDIDDDVDATAANDELTMSDQPSAYLDIPGSFGGPFSPRRASGASSVSGYGSEGPDRDRSHSTDSNASKFLPRFHKHRLTGHGSSPLHYVPLHMLPQFQQFPQSNQQDTFNEEELPPWTTKSTVTTTPMASTTDATVVKTSATESVSTSGNGHLTILTESIVAEPDIPSQQVSEQIHLAIPSTTAVATVSTSNSMDTLTGSTISGPSSPSNLSSVTLVGSTSDCAERDTPAKSLAHPFGSAPRVPLRERVPPPVPVRARPPLPTQPTAPHIVASLPKPELSPVQKTTDQFVTYALPPTVTTTHYTESDNGELKGIPSCMPSFGNSGGGWEGRRKSSAASMKSALSYMTDNSTSRRPSTETMMIGIPHAALSAHRHSLQPVDSTSNSSIGGVNQRIGRVGSEKNNQGLSHRGSKSTPEKIRKALFGSSSKDPRRFSESDDDASHTVFATPRGSLAGSSICTMSPRSSMQFEPLPMCSSKAGVVITSYRQSKRSFGPSDPIWSSTSTAASAFAIATSASSNPRDEPPKSVSRNESVVSSPATMRVLNVMRHWCSKHFQDFEQDAKLRNNAVNFLETISCSPNLLPSEHRAASQLIRLLTREDLDAGRRHIEALLSPPHLISKDNIETLSALEIAEQMTYLDHQIFMNIRCEEFLGQSWMKSTKHTRAENIIQMTKRFNDGSRLVSSEIMSRAFINDRVSAIEKWTAVADICRCLHNFNGVLQVCAAFTNAAVYRLKKTWDKVSKPTKQTINKLQATVGADGRFRAMRETLHRSDPPCIPYLGMYLTDLSFIEEGTPDFTPDGLLNFSKMRMVAHVIREIRHFQHIPYRIEHIPRVTCYLLDPSLLLEDDDMYARSLELEARQARLSVSNTQTMV